MKRKQVIMTILGSQPRKSNSRRIIKGRNGHPLVIKSANALEYEKTAGIQFSGKHRLNIEGFVDLRAVVYYRSKLSDLSLELIMDIMEKAGVYVNDRQVVSYYAMKGYDKKNPRIEILITEVTQEEYDDEVVNLLDKIKNKKSYEGIV